MFIKKAVKKIIPIMLIMTISPFATANIPSPPKVDAEAYVLMEYDTGKILNHLNEDKKLAPASLTKVMTAYVVFDELKRKKLNENDFVKISKKAWGMGGSKTYFKEGENVLVSDLMKGMIVQSGNDSSVALAEHIAGSVEDFSELMNYHAKTLGMKNSHFKNPTGLPARGHFTTARDLAILTKAIINDFPEYYYIYQLGQFTQSNITQKNRNKLLLEDLGFDGLKTGFTNNAGYCYIGSSKRGDVRLIVILLDSPSAKQRFADAKSLVNYGFRFYETHRVITANVPIEEFTTRVLKGSVDQVAVGAKDDILLVLERGQVEKLTYDIEIIEYASAPISKNVVVGSLIVMLDGKELGKTELITITSSEKGSLYKQFKDAILGLFKG